MSLSLSDIVNKDGIIQGIEQELGLNDGDISGNATQLALWLGRINSSLDKVFSKIFEVDGRWQHDDPNHSKGPFIFFDMTINQSLYNFTTDQQSNLILDIYAVYAKQSTTAPYYKLEPVDIQSMDENGSSNAMTNGLNVAGYPTAYDKTANGIRLDYLPVATVTNGIKVFINREGSYFTIANYSSITPTEAAKMPGFNGLFHEYLVLEPCYRYARAKLTADRREALKRDIIEMEKGIAKSYARRMKDERNIVTGKKILFI